MRFHVDTYTLVLPVHLPLTYKGRTLRVFYQLVIVTVGRPMRLYDLIWPVSRRIALAPTSPLRTAAIMSGLWPLRRIW
ncbi:hypothetical protein B0H15DRAFT_954971 [Mycena belliarum]|uniref:Uncharacterized protein n=1 Tax=Mycena belliarum TaxID=1033014 RepID=A0AAD6TWD3_9AGAR|nr:hypothetical protein B0H15DRAFT_954971 [Mycena belliae]